MRLFRDFKAFLVVFALFSGCVGSFPLKQATHHGYGRNERKYIQTAILWEFIMIPVYEFAIVGNVFILNPIDLWTGVRMLHVKGFQPSELNLIAKPAENGTDALLIISDKKGNVLIQDRMRKVSDDIYEVYDSSGALKATIFKTAGGYAMK